MPTPEPQAAPFIFESAIDRVGTKVRRCLEAYPDQVPLFTAGGRWRLTGVSEGGWHAGCLIGMLWDLYELTENGWWRERAEHYCRLVDAASIEFSRPGNGFVYFNGHKRWYDVTRSDGSVDASIRDRLVGVGRAQADLFRSSTNCLVSRESGCELTIERILDIPLMLFVAGETSDHELLDLAARHCAATRKYLVRGDGSVASAVRMDLSTGECGTPMARAGYRAHSTSACDQGWAILGFATAGRMLGFEPWLQTARQASQYAIERLSGNPIPPWDLDAPADPPAPRDAAAAAVVAAALFELADAEQTVGPDQARIRRHLQESALRILETLCSPDYLAGADETWEGVLKHGIGSLPAGWAVDEAVIWGEAMFVRALRHATRLLRHSRP